MPEISILNLVVNKSSSVIRQVFVKSFAADEEGKSVILINLPCFCEHEPFIKLIREKFGAVYSITYHSSVEKIGIEKSTFDGEPINPQNGYRVAVIHFKKKQSYQSFIDFVKSEETLNIYGDGKPLTGISKWVKNYNDSILDVKSLKEEITGYINSYDESIRLEKEQAKETEGIPDEEGWIKVSRHGKKPYLPNTESIDKKIIDKISRKKAKMEPFPYKIKKQEESM